MAKRFTSTEKWGDPWYRKLSPKHKCFWDWLFTNCDIAGTIDPDFGLAQFQIGDEITEDDLKPFEERIKRLPAGRIYLCKFLEFQYGTLTPTCRAHLPVMALIDRLSIPYQYCIDSLQDKEQEKDIILSSCDTSSLVWTFHTKIDTTGTAEQYIERIKKWVELSNQSYWDTLQKTYPKIDTTKEIEYAIKWLNANVEKRRTSLNIFFTNWLSKAQKRIEQKRLYV